MNRWNDFVATRSKVQSSENVLGYKIAGQFLMSMILRLSGTKGRSTLSHPDLHAGNIF